MKFQIPSQIFKTDIPRIPQFTKFIIDTDAGGDDAHAILVGLYIIKQYRPDAEIIGITAVSGNTNIINVIKNVNISLLLSHGEKRPSVYKGCHSDVLRNHFKDGFFKEDGLGGGVQDYYMQNLGLNDKKFDELHHATHAVDFIIESSQKYGNELCVICLGPLTNLFLVQQLYPEFVQKVGGLAIMGGTYLSIGNTHNACGEFNFITDVEAAAAVIQAPYKYLSIMPFDLVLGMKLDRKFTDIIFNNQHSTGRGEFILKMFEKVFSEGVNYYLCDRKKNQLLIDIIKELCVMMALMPELVKRGFQKRVQICKDGYARGQMIMDWFDKTNAKSSVFIITGIDLLRVQQVAAETNI